LGEAYGVECEEPESAHELILVPEARCGCFGRASYEDGCDCHDGPEPDSCACACTWISKTVRQGDPKDLATEEADVVYDECGKAGLLDDISPSIHGGSARDLGPHHEDQSD
jgi:hypothetical protein